MKRQFSSHVIYSHFGSLILLFLIGGAIFALRRIDHVRAASAPQATITITQPDGVSDKVAESGDYATEVWRDPWDMNESTDLSPYIFEIGNINVSGGIWSGEPTAGDPHIFILHSGVPRSQVVGKIGNNHPIDTAHYTRLSFRMYLETNSGYDEARLYWYTAYSNLLGWTKPIPVYSGWHVYDLDLVTSHADDSLSTWQTASQLTGLRLDPTMIAGREVRLDWIRLSPAPEAVADYTIQWSTGDLSGSEVVYLYADDDANFSNGYLAPIGSSPATDGSYLWNASAFPPGDYFVQARMGLDYAGLVRGDIWDMGQSTDATTVNITAPLFSGGLLSGTSGSDSQIYPQLDASQPIDGSFFTTFAVAMTLSASDSWTLYWWTDEGGPFWSGPYPAQSGAQIYSVDLSGDPNWAGKTITTLRFDPVIGSGINLQVDWIAVTTGSAPASEASLNVQTATSSGALTVNQAPILNITQPSRTSGEDYATAVLGNPWDMNDAADIQKNAYIPTAQFSGGLFTGSGVQDPGQPGFGDPNSNLIYVNPNTIDTNKYHYLTYRLYLETPPDTSLHFGPPYLDVARVVWQNVGHTDYNTTVDYAVYYDTWEQFTVDLRTVLMEHPTNPGGPPIIGGMWTGSVNTFRVDPHEAPEPLTAGTVPPSFSYDFVLLTADDTTAGDFDIQWLLNNPDEGVTVNLYCDLDTNPDNGMMFIGSTAQSAGGSVADSYTWDTGDLVGRYYVYIEADDGYNTRGWYGESPLLITWKTTPLSVYLPLIHK